MEPEDELDAPPSSPKQRISVAKLLKLHVYYNVEYGWAVADEEKRVICAGLPKDLAHLFAMAPAMLAFMYGISRRVNAPASADADRVYSRFNVEPTD